MLSSWSLYIALQQAERRSTRLVCRNDAPTGATRGSTSKTSKAKQKRTRTAKPSSDGLGIPAHVDGVDAVSTSPNQATASSKATRSKKSQPGVEHELYTATTPQSNTSHLVLSPHKNGGGPSVSMSTSEPRPAAAHHTPCRSFSPTFRTNGEVLVSPLHVIKSPPNSPNKSPSRGAVTASRDSPNPLSNHGPLPDISRLSPTPTKPIPSSKRFAIRRTDDDNEAAPSRSHRPQRNRVRPSRLTNYDEDSSYCAWHMKGTFVVVLITILSLHVDFSDPEPGPSTRKRRSVSILDTVAAPKKPKKRKTFVEASHRELLQLSCDMFCAHASTLCGCKCCYPNWTTLHKHQAVLR